MISVNLDKALKNEYYARAVFYDYNYNSAAHRQYSVSSDDMDKITAYWNKKGKINLWREQAAKDKTEYIIEGDDYDASVLEGKKSAEKNVGYSGKKDFTSLSTVGDIGVDAAYNGLRGGFEKKYVKSAVENSTDIINAETKLKNANENVKTARTAYKNVLNDDGATEFEKKEAKKVVKEAKKNKKSAEDALKNTKSEVETKAVDKAKTTGCIIGCAIAAAEGAKYLAARPNKEQFEAAETLLKSELPQAQNDLYNAQGDMLRSEEEIAKLTAEAEDTQEEANSKVEQNKTEYDMYAATYRGLKAKVQSGQKLSAGEKSLMKGLEPLIQKDGSLANENKNIQQEAASEVTSISSEIAGYQSDYDTSAETIGEVEGVTEYAAGFDENTRAMALIEGIGQTANAASGVKSALEAINLGTSGAWAFGATAWAYLAAAAGFAGAAASAFGAGEQFVGFATTDTEIGLRKGTQDLGEQTMDFYEDSTEVFAANQNEVDNELVFEMPQGMDGEDLLTNIPEEDTSTTLNNNLQQDKKTSEKKKLM